MDKLSRILSDNGFMSNFSEKLKELMKIKGLNQSELSELCGVSQNSISRWLSGKAEPSISNTIAVARALGVTVADLTGEEPLELKPADRKLLALPEEDKQIALEFLAFFRKHAPKIGD